MFTSAGTSAKSVAFGSDGGVIKLVAELQSSLSVLLDIPCALGTFSSSTSSQLCGVRKATEAGPVCLCSYPKIYCELGAAVKPA